MSGIFSVLPSAQWITSCVRFKNSVPFDSDTFASEKWNNDNITPIFNKTLEGVTVMTNVSMDEIKKLVSLQLGKRNFNEESLLVEDLNAESADIANIVAVLEEKYQITVTELEIAKIRTPSDLFRLASEKLSNNDHA